MPYVVTYLRLVASAPLLGAALAFAGGYVAAVQTAERVAGLTVEEVTR